MPSKPQTLKVTMEVGNRTADKTYGRIRLVGPGLCEFSALRTVRPHRRRNLTLEIPMVSIQKGQYTVDLLVFEGVDAVGRVEYSYTVNLPLEGEIDLTANSSAS